MKIALLDDYQRVARTSADWSQLPAGHTLEVFHEHLGDGDAVVRKLAEFDIVMAMRERTPFPAGVLEKLPQLKLLASTGPRNAAIDLEAATRLGVVVCHTKGAPYSTMELTWGLILSLARHIPQEHHALRQGRWQTTVGLEMNGRTLGTVGLGHIGTQVARIATAFRMRVLAWSQNLTPEKAGEAGAEMVSLEKLLRDSDIVTIHTRLSPRTRGLLGAKQLALMKPTALLINSSRGPIVDEAALVDALRAKRIAGAGLDTYDQEPLPAGHPLLKLDNVVVTPHLGYVERGALDAMFSTIFDQVLAYAAGDPIHVVNPEALRLENS